MRYLLILLLLIATPAHSAVIFSESYDSVPDTHSGSTVPSGWSAWSADESSTLNSVTHHAGEVSSSGRGGSGKAFKQWRRNGSYFLGYAGIIDKYFSWSDALNKPRTIYSRYYMKWPNAIKSGEAAGYTNKFGGRPYYDTSQGQTSFALTPGIGLYDGGKVIFVLANGVKYWDDSNIEVTKTVAQMGLNDGNWHSVEFYYKLGTTGNADGELGFWVDGVPQQLGTYINANGPPNNRYYTCAGVANPTGNQCVITGLSGFSSNWYFTMPFVPGMGNTGNFGAEPYSISPDVWLAIEYDDYVTSTTYIGPDGTTPTPTPTTTYGPRIQATGRFHLR